MRKFLLLFSILALAISGCNNGHKHTFTRLVVRDDASWRTYLPGSDFNSDGLTVFGICSSCKAAALIDYSLSNDTDLQLGQTSVTIEYGDLSLEYPIQVKEKLNIACIGDSLTAGHYWANESYPTKLAGMVDDSYVVKNCGVNGISITGYGGSWKDPEMRYIKQDVYQESVDFKPDIFAIMLGTNDATEWSKAEPTFKDEYKILLDSYLEQFPLAKYIMMVSPPVVSPNQFSIPNDEIRDYVNPIQRELAEEYGFTALDLRKEFEETPDYQTKFLRPNDDVHFTAEAAEFVAGRVWDIIKNYQF